MHGFEGDARPLRILFLDLNSYFASVEQQEHPELRGKPVAVVPVQADTSFVIAASYEAKAFGIRTGTKIGDARRMCPELQMVSTEHSCYAYYHDRIIEAVETVLPVEKVHSIDEMHCRLLGDERDPANAAAIAQLIKDRIAELVGECLRCSIGIAPNVFLAKIGTELQKPDGLVVLQQSEIQERVESLKLIDLPGINRKMLARLQAKGIFTTSDLYACDRTAIKAAFGSIVGERWWYLLRGYELPEEETHRKSMGHSHVLPPKLRTASGTREVLLRLTQKAASRLRSERLWTRSISIKVNGFTRSWEAHCHCEPTQDSVSITQHVLRLWEDHDFESPRLVAITFSDLSNQGETTPSLFDEKPKTDEMSHVLDALNQKFGKNTVFLAAMHRAKDTAQERIAFNKTWLFSEGKGDHEWIDTRHPPKKK